MNYYLFFDDLRNPIDVFTYKRDIRYKKSEWIVVRSYKEFTQVIEKLDIPSVVSLDHDLSDQHYGREDLPWSVEGEIDYFSYKEKTGYECAKWLCDYCLDNNHKLPEILIHSCNNVGATNIKTYINNFLKHNPELS